MADNSIYSKPLEGGQGEGNSREQKKSLEKPISISDILDNGLEPTPGSYAAIMETNKPDPRGPGYIKLYILAATIFLCSTMSGGWLVLKAAVFQANPF